jgi:hypothetical protein
MRVQGGDFTVNDQFPEGQYLRIYIYIYTCTYKYKYIYTQLDVYKHIYIYLYIYVQGGDFTVNDQYPEGQYLRMTADRQGREVLLSLFSLFSYTFCNFKSVI